MSALQHATASTEVASLLACCGDILHQGTQTLSMAIICHRLDELEVEWNGVMAQTQLTVSACTQALQHYHDVYETCAHTVPLPQAVWDRWVAGITASFPVRDASRDSQLRLETLREALLTKYWGLFCRLYWGCARAVKPRLAFVLEQAHAATTAAASAAPTSTFRRSDSTTELAAGTYTVESLERVLAAPLHAFAKLAYDMSHLFGDYAAVGAVERQWLNEDILGQLGDSAETTVEALVRRSFKRDLQVPSANLPALLQEYKENEVDERKSKEIVAIGEATLRSSWMRVATVLHEHLLTLSNVSDTTTETLKPGSDKLLYDNKAYQLLEELLTDLRKTPHSHGSLPALGLLTHRVAEWRPMPTTSTQNLQGVGFNGSQTQFYLFLLHKWFSRYISSQHRWSVTDMFNAPDDSDLWSFLLDRHTFCLLWALVTVAPDSDSKDKTTCGAQEQFMAAMEARINKLRAIFYSVAHCLQLYRASVTRFTNPEKRTVRLIAARAATHEWMKRVGASRFCRGLLGDLLDTAEEWDNANVQTPALQLWTLNAETELKLIMYDTMQLLGCPNNTTDRLETLVQTALERCTLWKEMIIGKATVEASDARASLFGPLVALAVRIVQRIRAKLQHSLTLTSELSSADVELHLKLVEWVKELLSATSAFVKPAELNAMWDEYMYLVSLHTPFVAVDPDGDVTSTTEDIPDFIGYAAAAARREFGAASLATGGLADISWERRNAFKSHRQREESELQLRRSLTSSMARENDVEMTPLVKRARAE